MALVTFSKIAVAYNNLVNPSTVSSVTQVNIPVVEGGFPLSNLEYEDPWTMLRTASVTVTWDIIHTFTSSVGPMVLGIINHNLWSTGHSTVNVRYFSGSWVSIGTISLASDSDIIIPWDNVVSSTQWKFTSSAPGNPNFYIGSVFYGSYRQFDRNPMPAGIRQTVESNIITETSAGGARHVSFGSKRRVASYEIAWDRTTIADRNFFQQLPTITDPTYLQSALIGIYPPEHGDLVSATDGGSPLFFGYISSIDDSPRGPGMHLTGQPARYDMVVHLMGA